MVGVHVMIVFFHDGVSSFCRDLLSQRTDLLVFADPASILLSQNDGEVVAYTDHSVLVPYSSEGHLCDNDVVFDLPFFGIDGVPSLKKGEGDTYRKVWNNLKH